MKSEQTAAAILFWLPLVLGAAAPASEAPPGVGPECSSTALAQPIADPLRWSALCFSRDHGPEAGDSATIRSFELDIDGDGVSELFVGSTFARGNAGGVHYAFRRHGTIYNYLGKLVLHPDAVRALPPQPRQSPVLLAYIRLGADEGDLEWITYDGKQFTTVHSERIFPKGRDKDFYCTIFGCS